MKLNDKKQAVLNANGKVVRNDGFIYRVIANKTGPLILACAEQIFPLPNPNQSPINLFARTKLSTTLRTTVEMGLVS